MLPSHVNLWSSLRPQCPRHRHWTDSTVGTSKPPKTWTLILAQKAVRHSNIASSRTITRISEKITELMPKSRSVIDIYEYISKRRCAVTAWKPVHGSGEKWWSNNASLPHSCINKKEVRHTPIHLGPRTHTHTDTREPVRWKGALLGVYGSLLFAR